MKTFVITIILFYFAGVFLEDSFNIMEWAYETKTMMVVSLGFITSINYLLGLTVKNNNHVKKY